MFMLDNLDDEDGIPAEAPRLTALTALALIATRLGVETSVEELRRRFSLEEAEPSSDTLVSIAKDLGLEAAIMHVSFAELPTLAKTLPAILRARDGAALILEDARSDPMKGTVALVRDPISADPSVAMIEEDQLAEVWEGEILLIKRLHGLADEEQPFGFAWLVAQVLRDRKIFGDIAIASFVMTVFSIAPAFIFMGIIDRVIVNHSLSTLNVLAGGLFLLLVFEPVLSHARGLLTITAAARLDARLNIYVIDKLLKLPMEYFEHQPTGRTLGKLQTGKVRHFMAGPGLSALLETIPLLGIIPILFVLEWRLAVMVFVLAGSLFLIIRLCSPALGRAIGRYIESEIKKGSHLVETLHGIKTIKSLALEGRRRKEWDQRVATSITTQYTLGRVYNFIQTYTLPVQRFMWAGVFMTGAYLILTDPHATLNPGTLVAFSMLAQRVGSPLIKIAKLQMELGEIRGSIGLIASVVNAPPEENRVNGLKQPITGFVEFRDVRFRYSPTAAYALDGVSFTVPKGTVLGIMGRSGSGKTTVTRLLQRLNSSYEGSIKIDGMDLKEIDLNHLRTNIGVVPQENFLFSGTIRENIGMAKSGATFMDVVRAAQMAGAEEFIERMPRGYDTVLEEGATNLSGGQRQRLAIARALLIDPPIFILDEATSALDAESEAIVNANLKRMSEGRTVLTISHRLSMLVEADAILVLERGKVYDLGTHDELLARCDIYQNMWYQQNRHLRPERAKSQLIQQQASDT
jgi:ATP-binding cassette subfamily B protein